MITFCIGDAAFQLSNQNELVSKAVHVLINFWSVRMKSRMPHKASYWHMHMHAHYFYMQLRMMSGCFYPMVV